MVVISSLFPSWWGDAYNQEAASFNNNLSSTVIIHPPWQAPTKLHQLQDELLQEIFSRLPAKYVLRCKSVCRRWNALTSTQYFAQLHQNNCFNPTILVEKMVRFSRDYKEIRNVKKKLYSFDGWEGGETHETSCETLKKDTRPKFHEHRELLKYMSPQFDLRKDVINVKYMRPQFEYRHVDADAEQDDESTLITAFSSCGLVIFHQQNGVDEPFSPYCIILNPITREKVTIRSNNSIRGLVYALFYHPILKEFCILWGQVPIVRSFPWRFLELKLLNLGPSEPCWRNVDVEQMSCFKKHPPRFTFGKGVEAPVILDDVVYWMVDVVDGHQHDYDPSPDVWWPNCCQEAILAYNIKNEEFFSLPHPGSGCESWNEAVNSHNLMVLIQNGSGHLSICQFSWETRSINIWIFKKLARMEEGLWIKHRTIQHYPSGIRTRNPFRFCDFRPIMLIDKELLLVYWAGLDLIVCDLKLGICEQYLTAKKMDKDEPILSMHAHTQKIDKKIDKDETTLFMHAHNHSFVSMGRSKLEILMETNTENIVSASKAPHRQPLLLDPPFAVVVSIE